MHTVYILCIIICFQYIPAVFNHFVAEDPFEKFYIFADPQLITASPVWFTTLGILEPWISPLFGMGVKNFILSWGVWWSADSSYCLNLTLISLSVGFRVE